MGRMMYCSPKNVFDSGVTLFPYRQDIGNVVLLAFDYVVRVTIENDYYGSKLGFVVGRLG